MHSDRPSPWEPQVLEPDAALPEVPRQPAPWTLRAQGYVVVVLMPAQTLDTAAFVPEGLVPKRRGRTSVMLFIDYKEAVCGNYQELLLAPAAYETPSGTHPTITRIFVSSYESVVNGRRNWGIPKDLARFTREHDASRASDRIVVSRGGDTLVDMKLRAYGPTLPVRTWLLPAGMRTLVQHWNGTRYRFTLHAQGRARLATVEDWRFDPRYFPDLARGRVLTATYLPDFQMTFPDPQTQPYEP